MSILRPLVKVSGRLTPAKQNVLVTYDIVKQSFWTSLNSDLWKYRETHWKIIFAPTSSKWSFLLKIFLESESKTHIVRWIYSKFPVGLFTFTKIIVEGEFVVCEIYDLEPKKFSTLIHYKVSRWSEKSLLRVTLSKHFSIFIHSLTNRMTS